jgi:lipopolysaccharide biosynthesis glycosyltransferase
MNLRVHATVTTDVGYLEAAVATATSLSKTGVFQSVSLLLKADHNYESSKNEVPSFLRDALYGRVGHDFRVILYSDFFPELDYAHFNNTIIYKLLAPIIIQVTDGYVCNFDAGTFPGEFFKEFIASAIASNSGVVSAYVHELNSPMSPDVLSAASKQGWGNDSYASGIVLLFNIQKYHSANVLERLQLLVSNFFSSLMNADQELLMLLFSRKEVSSLPEAVPGCVKFLSLDFNSWSPWNNDALRRSAWWKVCGSVKPWKYWCLDPNKFFYLRWFSENANYIPHSHYRFLDRSRWSGGQSYFDRSTEFYHSHFQEIYSKIVGNPPVGL